ncbi:hypothetical protein JW905_11550, partial [bacterium]|nr:hypothetical protein [candidate division CSSED10-310 bacterium]
SENIIHTGIFSGMSGSPVYLDGRLMGAVAYAFPYAKESLAGVTPIGRMTALDGGRRTRGIPTTRGTLPILRAQWPQPLSLQPPKPAAGTARSLLLLEGIPTGAVPHLSAPFLQHQLVPVSAGVTGNAIGPAVLEPGATIVVPLISGDINVAAAGTITSVDGDSVLGFGHGFLETGPCAMPLQSGIVHTVITSYQQPFKLSSPVAMVGSVLQDLSAGIFGRLGAAPDTMQFSLVLREESGTRREYRLLVTPEPAMLPQLLLIGAGQLIARTLRGAGFMSARGSLELDIGGETVNCLVSAVEADSAYVLANGLLAPVYRLYEKAGRFPDVRTVALDIELVPRLEAGEIVRIHADRRWAAPGGTVAVSALVERTNRDPEEVTVPLPVPERRSLQNAWVMVMGTPDWERWMRQRERSDHDDNPSEIVDSMRRLNSPDGLHVLLAKDGVDLALPDADFTDLPARMHRLLTSRPATGAWDTNRFTIISTAFHELPYRTTGSLQLKLPVMDQ